jgi:hypothetical protein
MAPRPSGTVNELQFLDTRLRYSALHYAFYEHNIHIFTYINIDRRGCVVHCSPKGSITKLANNHDRDGQPVFAVPWF